jgi:hypothetical protein
MAGKVGCHYPAKFSLFHVKHFVPTALVTLGKVCPRAKNGLAIVVGEGV